MNTKTRYILILTAFFAVSCSKDSTENPDNPNGSSKFEGQILYTSAGGNVYEVDLQSGVQKTHFTYNTYGFNSWTLSKDGQYRLTSEREAGDYVNTKFTLIRTSDGQIVKEFNYVPPRGNSQTYRGQLSPDNSKVLIEPDYHNGIIIIDTDGNVLHHLEGVNNTVFGSSDEALWLPDNSILFTFNDQYILRSPPPYTDVTLVREMPYAVWGNLRVDAEGKKISARLNNHIHVMDIDGNNIVQVTDSDNTENYAVFSPDGKYLVVAANFVTNNGYVNLKIIPNDGKTHHTDNDAVVVQPVNETLNARAYGPVFWTR